jgi:hypothetical protein
MAFSLFKGPKAADGLKSWPFFPKKQMKTVQLLDDDRPAADRRGS